MNGTCVRSSNVPVLFDFSCEVNEGEVVSIVGSNGAGKSTLMKVISGIIKPTGGEIEFQGERIDKLPAHKIVERGIAHVPEGRQVFGKLSVRENLMMGAFTVKSDAQKQSVCGRCLTCSPSSNPARSSRPRPFRAASSR